MTNVMATMLNLFHANRKCKVKIELKNKLKIKKCFSLLVFLCLCFCGTKLFSADDTSQKLVPSGHWAYTAINEIFLDAGRTALVQSAPLSVGELKFYLEEVDYNALSEYARTQYDRVLDYFKGERKLISSSVISMGIGASITPEVYARSNDNIDWSHRYFFKDRFFAFPVFMSVTDYVYIESDFMLGRNYWSLHNNQRWKNQNGTVTTWTDDNNTYFNSNSPFNFNSRFVESFEFDWPRTAYLSIGAKVKDKPFFNFQLGRGSSSIGHTQNGSLVLSENFETDGYIQFSFFSPNIRYTLNVTQADTKKYLYTHRMDFRLFKKLQFSVLEGTYVNSPFELRYLNPFMIIHSFSNWNRDDGDKVCAYLAFAVDYTPVKYLRLYVLYAQNEMRGLVESGHSTEPNSLGFQAGAETTIPYRKGAWKVGLEGVYTMPWLYIKSSPDASLVTFKHQEHGAGPGSDRNDVTSWIGTPFGPDSVGGSLKFGYEAPGKWTLFLNYLFLAQGPNAFADDLFYLNGKRRNPDPTNKGNSNNYYPTDLPTAAGEKEAERVAPSGTPQFTNRIMIEGTYYFTPKISLSGKIGYIIILNRFNESDNTQHGVEFAISVSFKLL